MATKTTISDKKELMIEQLRARLTGTRRKAPGTIISYTSTARRFLQFVGTGSTFTPKDVDRYFAMMRKKGISERTLGKEFVQLKKLAQVLEMPWPFTGADKPFTKEKPRQPVLKPEYLEQMILAQAKLTDAERFYLAVASTFACRREALVQLKKRDYDDTTLVIHGVHGGETVRHLIPPVLKPVIAGYRLKKHSISALSLLFNRIVRKSGLKLEKGHGWHSLRRCITSVMRYVLPANGIDAGLWAEFTGWSRTAEGKSFFGSAMMGYYTHPEILNSPFMQKLGVLTGETRGNDPYWMDNSIYLIHPFLKLWEKALKPEPAVKLTNP